MKHRTVYTFIALSMVVPSLLWPQKGETPRDTLFFWFDTHYTIDSDSFSGDDYAYFEKTINTNLSETGTNGYIYFKKDTIVHGLEPKEILSFKEYIENRGFYYEGEHNRMVQKWKLEKKLLDRYTIFLVRGGEFIKPKRIWYNSYYPIQYDTRYVKKKGELYDPRNRDTLYFEFSEGMLKPHMGEEDVYVVENCKPGCYFEVLGRTQNLKPKEVLDLWGFRFRPRFYFGEQFFYQMDGYAFYDYLSHYVVYLVRRDEFLEVQAYTAEH